RAITAAARALAARPGRWHRRAAGRQRRLSHVVVVMVVVMVLNLLVIIVMRVRLVCLGGLSDRRRGVGRTVTTGCRDSDRDEQDPMMARHIPLPGSRILRSARSLAIHSQPVKAGREG